MRARLSSLLLCCACFAQVRIDAPQFGVYRDRLNRVRPLTGIDGNLLSGGPLFEDATASAFSGRLGLAVVPGRLVAFLAGGEIVASEPASSGEVLFGFSGDGAAAAALFPESRALWEWRDGALTRIDCDLPGGIRAVAVTVQGEILLLAADGIYRLRAGQLEVVRSLSVPDGSAALTPDGAVVFAEEHGITLDKPGESPLFFPLDFRTASMEWIGPGLLLLRPADQGLLMTLRITPGRPRPGYLPEAPE